MKREEAKKYLSSKLPVLSVEMREAIKALEQEPILDKITEIIEPLRHSSFEMTDIEWQILQAIEKYKADQEVNE